MFSEATSPEARSLTDSLNTPGALSLMLQNGKMAAHFAPTILNGKTFIKVLKSF